MTPSSSRTEVSGLAGAVQIMGSPSARFVGFGVDHSGLVRWISDHPVVVAEVN
jgi:hypothetical protein